mmetsp:Transcript_67242/g.119754  ORF Transcript_67242/g.119754 Transcript_67242/m.119754 type:complete len:479 (-) Transcript_67242:123-1559(-)
MAGAGLSQWDALEQDLAEALRAFEAPKLRPRRSSLGFSPVAPGPRSRRSIGAVREADAAAGGVPGDADAAAGGPDARGSMARASRALSADSLTKDAAVAAQRSVLLSLVQRGQTQDAMNMGREMKPAACNRSRGPHLRPDLTVARAAGMRRAEDAEGVGVAQEEAPLRAGTTTSCHTNMRDGERSSCDADVSAWAMLNRLADSARSSRAPASREGESAAAWARQCPQSPDCLMPRSSSIDGSLHQSNRNAASASSSRAAGSGAPRSSSVGVAVIARPSPSPVGPPLPSSPSTPSSSLRLGTSPGSAYGIDDESVERLSAAAPVAPATRASRPGAMATMAAAAAAAFSAAASAATTTRSSTRGWQRNTASAAPEPIVLDPRLAPRRASVPAVASAATESVEAVTAISKLNFYTVTGPFNAPPIVDPEEAPECAICMENFSDGEIIRTLRCLHRFHPCCVDPWLTSRWQCPLCKLEVATR